MGLEKAFAYLGWGTVLWAASFRAGLGLLFTGGIVTLSQDVVIFSAINLAGIYYWIKGAWYFLEKAIDGLIHTVRELEKWRGR